MVKRNKIITGLGVCLVFGLTSPLVIGGGTHAHSHADESQPHSHADERQPHSHAAEKPVHDAHDDGHAHSHADSTSSSVHSAKDFRKSRNIDGYTVDFQVAEAPSGMRHGGNHNFMIQIKKDNRTLEDVVINSKVIYPDGKSQSKMLMKMGDWFMNGYDLETAGQHQMMILFKTADGKKHVGGVYYTRND